MTSLAFPTLFSPVRLFAAPRQSAARLQNVCSRAFHCSWVRRENGASPKSFLYKRTREGERQADKPGRMCSVGLYNYNDRNVFALLLSNCAIETDGVPGWSRHPTVCPAGPVHDFSRARMRSETSR